MNDNLARVAIDAMGGDYAPQEVVAGACRAAQSLDCKILLVGARRQLEEVAPQKSFPDSLEVVDAPETVAMDEAPMVAVRRGAVTSMGKCIDLVRDGLAQAAFSAGNSGAFLALATIRLRTLPGIARPAFATVWPARNGPMLLLDAGANVDCRPEWLVQFAVMGSAYVRAVLGIQDPKVGLLSIGEEEAKGNALTEAAFPLLSAAPIHFIGNVEGRDLLLGQADVIVCDGFVGNVALKLGEATGEYFFDALRDISTSTLRGKIGAAILRPSLRSIRNRFDHREYGGAPVLGLRGNCIIGHGRADARAVFNATKLALRAIKEDLVGTIGGILAQPAQTAVRTPAP